jgi:hypothetical protein
MIPAWLHIVAVTSLGLGAASAIAIAVDVMRRPQAMGIMNLVWPLAATFGGLAIVAFYLACGRAAVGGRQAQRGPSPPMAVSVAKGALHCGAGCALGDAVAEVLLFWFPGIATWFGLGSIFHTETFAAWGLDYVLALTFGIGFQYFAIAPMRGLHLAEGLVAAAKADVLSLTAWQIGMYGVMALGLFILLPAFGSSTTAPTSPEFWFLMQLAMIGGFASSYPVNWWLVRSGVKEAM